ncbi:MAG TPA: molybdopterin dinucleotide binding domain-containing protein, partial [Rhabdaerophilum sp.]|nr:molybdopterin dinucleotide binding domain-containing protein [Rhabdaerophilum sp.]
IEQFLTDTARYADIVLPATTTLERNDIGAAANDPYLIPMKAIVPPVGESRSDYQIFCALAETLGILETFSGGRKETDWLREIYATTADAMAMKGWAAASFDEFWSSDELALPTSRRPDPLTAFRLDPKANALATASGKIELYSETIAGFGYADCPGHPTWIEPDEWLGSQRAADFPFQLVANQPANKLHSQLDFARHSAREKRDGLAVLAMHREDAAALGMTDGDVVIVRSPRGACLAALALTNGILRGVVQMPTGAWYRPVSYKGETICAAGNPNSLTRDKGTSSLAQGTTGQLCLVRIEPAESSALEQINRPANQQDLTLAV